MGDDVREEMSVAPPQDVAAEMGALGSMLLDPEGADAVRHRLEAADFYRLAHQTLFRAICKSIDDRGTVDLVLLKSDLRAAGELERVGGQAYLMELMEATPTSANGEYYADIVSEHAMRRDLLRLREVVGEAGEPGSDVHEIVSRLESHLLDSGSRADVPLIREHLLEANKRMERIANGEQVGLRTGFAKLDRKTGGLEPGTYVVICGDTSVGKTAFASNILLHVAEREKVPTALFSAEVTGPQMAVNMARIMERFNFWEVPAARFSEDQWRKWTDANERLAASPLYVDDTGGIAIEELCERARWLVRKRGVALIVVDYIQLLRLHARADGETLRLKHISNELKALAQGTRTVVMALSQRSTTSSGRRRTRYAPEIEHDADVVIYIDRAEAVYDAKPEDEPSVCGRKVVVGKGRNVGTGHLDMEFNKPLLKFEEKL